MAKSKEPQKLLKPPKLKRSRRPRPLNHRKNLGPKSAWRD